MSRPFLPKLEASAGGGRMGGQTKAKQNRILAERQRRSAKVQRQGPAPIWTEPAAQADETRHPTKRDGKAQQHGHLSHGAIAKAKRLSDLAQRLQTLIADQFPPSWAAPLKGRGLHRPLLRAYNDAHGMLEPQPFGFKSAHALLHTVLKELLPEAETTRRPKPPRALAACPPVRPAQQELLPEAQAPGPGEAKPLCRSAKKAAKKKAAKQAAADAAAGVEGAAAPPTGRVVCFYHGGSGTADSASAAQGKPAKRAKIERKKERKKKRAREEAAACLAAARRRKLWQLRHSPPAHPPPAPLDR